MDPMDYEEDEDDEAAGEALTVPLLDAFSGLQGECEFLITCYCTHFFMDHFFYGASTALCDLFIFMQRGQFIDFLLFIFLFVLR